MPEESGGGIVKRTVFQFDFDLSTANKSNEQLIEMQKRLRAEVEKSEKEIQSLLNQMSKMQMGGELSGAKRQDYLAIGEQTKSLMDFARTASRVIQEIDIRLGDVSKQADLFGQQAKEGMSVVKSEAQQAEAAIAKIGKAFTQGQTEAKEFAAVVAKSADRAAADAAALLSAYQFGAITPTRMARGKPAENQAFQAELFDFGNAVQMGGGMVRMPTYSEEIEQFEQFIRTLLKAEPILVSESQTVREYAVQMDNLATVSVRVKKILNELGEVTGLRLDPQVLPEMNEFNAKALALQKSGHNFFATIEDGAAITKIFAKVLDGSVVSVAKISGEIDTLTGDLKRVNTTVLDSKADFAALMQQLNVAWEAGTVTSFLPEQQLQMMMLALGKFAQDAGMMTKKQRQEFEAAQQTFIEGKMLAEQAENSQRQLAAAMDKTTTSIQAEATAEQEIIDITPRVVEATERQIAAQNELQGELEQTQAQLRETAATTPFGINIPPVVAGGGRGGAGGGRGGAGGADDMGGGRTNPAMELRNEVLAAYEALQRMTDVRDFPGLIALQKELDVLRQKLIRLADDSRMGLVSIETAGDMAEEYVMTAKEFTQLWQLINRVALELEKADKSFKSFGQMKPGTEAQTFFNELDRALKNIEASFKRGEINATDYFRRLQLIGEAVGETGRRSDIYASALQRAQRAMATEKAAAFRKALSDINIELLKGGSQKTAITNLEKLKKEYADNAQAIERIDRTIKKLKATTDKELLKEFNDALRENRILIKEGEQSLQEYLVELERAFAEWQKSTKTQPGFGPRLREEIVAVKKEIATAQFKELGNELTRIQNEFAQTPSVIEPLIQRLNELKAQWAGNETAINKIDRVMKQIQTSFASNNFGAFKEQIAGIKAQFQAGEISAREWYEQLQLLLATVGTSGPAFNELARNIQQARNAMDAAAMREYKSAVQELTAQAASGAITQRQLVAGLEALRPQVEGNAAAMQHLEIAIAKAKRGAGDLGVIVNSLGQIFKTAKHHAMWMVSGALIMPLYNLPYQLMETAKKLDTSFAKLKTVIQLDPEVANDYGALTEKMRELEKVSFEFAKYYGEDVEKVNEVLFTVAQRYKKTADIVVVSNAAMRLSILDNNENIEETGKQLMSLIAQYNIAPKEINNVINKIIVAQNAVRATAGEIMEGLTRSASAFKGIGADIDTSISMIAASLEQTGRSAESVGTSWRNLISRFGGGVEKVTEILRKYGIEVYNNLQENEDFAKTIEEIRKKYALMSDQMKGKFITEISGMRQRQTLQPLLDDLQNVDNTLKRVRDSISGSREEMANVVNQAMLTNLMTYERRIKSVSAVWAMFVRRMAESPKVKAAVFGLLTGFMKLMYWIDKHSAQLLFLIKVIGFYLAVTKGLLPIFRLLAGGFTMVTTTITQARTATVMLAGTQGRLSTWAAVTVANFKNVAQFAKAAAVQIGGMIVLAQAAAVASKAAMSPDEKYLDNMRASMEYLNVAEWAGRKDVYGSKYGGSSFGSYAKGLLAEVPTTWKHGYIGTADAMAEAQQALDEAGGDYAKAREIIQAKIDEKQNSNMEAEMQKYWGDMDKFMDDYEKNASDITFPDEITPQIMDNTQALKDQEDAEKAAAAMAQKYSADLRQIGIETKTIIKAQDEYQKQLERQKDLLFDLLKLLPGQIPSDERLKTFMEGFNITMDNQNSGILQTIYTMQRLNEQLEKLYSLQAQVGSQTVLSDSMQSTGVVVARTGSALATLSAQAGQYLPLFQKYAEAYGMPLEAVLAMAKTESNFNPKATSPKGAMGLMQLMPGTAADLGVINAYDPEQNIRGGVAYMRRMYDEFYKMGGWDAVFASYNAGPGAVRQYGGVPPYTETKNYVAKINKMLGGDVGPAGQISKTGEKLETLDDQITSEIESLEAKYKELQDSVVSSYRSTFDMISEFSQIVGNVYSSLYDQQSEWNQWMMEQGFIGFDEYMKRFQDSNYQVGQSLENLGINVAQARQSIQKDLERGTNEFFTQIGRTLEYLDKRRGEVLREIAEAKTPEDIKSLKDKLTAIDLERTYWVGQLAYGREYIDKVLKPSIELKKKELEQSLQLLDLEIARNDIFRQRREIQRAYTPMTDAEYYADLMKEQLQGAEDYEKLINAQIALKMQRFNETKNEIEQAQILNEILQLRLGIDQKYLDSQNQIKEYMDEQAKAQRLLINQRYEYLKLGATEQEERMLDLQNLERQVQENMEDIQRNISWRQLFGMPVNTDALMRDESIREAITNIVDLRLEMLKLDPVLTKINELARQAVDSMKEAIKENIKAVVSGEKNLGQALTDILKRRTEIMKETMVEAFSEAIIMKAGGPLSDFEKQMQDMSAAIFSLFGLEAPDKKAVLEKVLTEVNGKPALRVIMGDKSELADSIASNILGGGRTGISSIADLFMPGGTVEPGGITGKGKGKVSLPDMKKTQTTLRMLGYQMAGQYVSQIVADAVAGQEQGLGTQLGGSLGYALGTSGAIFGGLGAAAGPVGMIVGTLLGSTLDNAFGVGRGERRRQAMAEQRAARAQEIEDIKGRFGALGFSEEYINQMAAQVPDFIERSKRSFMGLSGTSRWLEGGEAVYAEINRQKAMLDLMEKTVKDYNSAISESNHQLAMGIGRFDVYGKEMNAYAQAWNSVDWQGGRVALRVAGQTFDEYSASLMRLSGAGGALLSPFLNMNNEFNTLTDRISMLTYWMNEMKKVGLETTDTFKQVQEQLYELQQKKYWADIFQPLKEGEWLQQFGMKTDQDLLEYYKKAVGEAFGYQGEITESVMKDLAEMLAPEVGLLETGQIEGFQAQDTQYRMELLQALWQLTNKISDNNLAQAAANARGTVGEAISGTAQVVQNYNSFEVNAENYFSTQTEMLNIAKQFATMIKQQGWIDETVFNI